MKSKHFNFKFWVDTQNAGNVSNSLFYFIVILTLNHLQL
jgi:hypothetical protein